MPDLRQQLESTLGGTYALERELGGGGMSRVFVATESALGRRVVVKVLPPEASGGLSAERFRREVAFAARLQHPCIVPLLSAGDAGGLLYYTMPFVSGDSLRSRIARRAPDGGGLPVRETIRVLRDVSSALSYAHAEGVVHRDLKPDNVLLSGGYALVTDFGVAKALSAAATSPGSVTSTNVIVGTPLYMAPEQAAGDSSTDHRADIYALGVVAYEMLAGAPPFSGRTPHQLIAAHIAEIPEPLDARRPNVPVALAALVMRCLAKNPVNRPPSAHEVLSELDALAPSTEEAATAFAPRLVRRTDSVRRRALSLAAVGAIVIGLLGYGAWSLVRDQRTASDGARAAAAADGHSASTPRSVAVLPFANIGADTATQYFADGMTDELINALARIEGLRVPGRASAFALKGRNLGVRAAGDTLRVAHVLAGSVRRAGGRLRVTAQLVSVRHDSTLWSDTYDREVTDIFAVQEEIARAIVGALQIRFATPPAEALIGRHTQDVEAYDLYLQGRFLWSQRTGEALMKSIALFERAIQRDHRYAGAYAALAEAYVVLPFYTAYSPRDAFTKARTAARAALALDSTLAGAWASLGYIRLAEWDWTGAESEFQRAIRLNPAEAMARSWYATLLGRVLKRDDEAMRELRLASQLDPLSRTNRTDLALLLYVQGRYDDATAELRQVLELDPGFAAAHQLLGRIHMRLGHHAEAVAELERSAGIAQRQIARGWLASAYAAAGERGLASAILEDFARQDERGYVSPFAMALAHTALGQREEAFAWLQRAAAAQDPFFTINHREPLLDPLRSDPRFGTLLRRMRLPP
jgi:eukaryotic-like serine/threonine-protein kinase